MNKHYENIHRYDFLTKEILEEEYTKNGLSDQQIADKFKMPSKTVVWRKRKKFGILNRYAAKSNKHAKKNRKFSVGPKKAETMLAAGMTFSQIAAELGCSVMVAKRRFKELGLCRIQEHAEKYGYWEVELTESQKQFIIGSTLGDGTLTKRGSYSCSHSVEQKEYHEHKRHILSSIHSGKFQHAVHKASSVDGKHFESYHFTTGVNKFLKSLYGVYYSPGRKIFPYTFLMENITSESLAYWYMDDGSYNINKGAAQLCTYGYTVLEQILIKDLLLKKFGIHSKIYYRKKRDDYYQYFYLVETLKLFDLIRPWVIPSMMYKVHYNGQPKQI